MDYRSELEECINRLDILIREVEERLKNSEGAETFHLNVSTKNDTFRYYKINDDGSQTYIKRRDLGKVRRAVQREYDEKVYAEMSAAKGRIERFLRNYNPENIKGIYSNMGEARRALVQPITMPDEEYINKWCKRHPGNQNPYPNESGYYTERGELVRSKSEKILADMLYRNGIPYSYEPGLTLNKGGKIYPDFALLDVKRRKTIYWEHFGMITKADYAVDGFEKLRKYEASGFVLGEDVIITTESSEMPLDIRGIERMIKRCLS